jgi:hypothetical protein
MEKRQQPGVAMCGSAQSRINVENPLRWGDANDDGCERGAMT